jgi:hypothetical protein
MTTDTGRLSLNLGTTSVDRTLPGNCEGSAPKPTPPSDHIPLGGVVRFRPSHLSAFGIRPLPSHSLHGGG